MRGSDKVGGGRAGAEALAAVTSRHWLLERYWIFAWTIVLLASPLLMWRGSRVDLMAVGVYAGITSVSWLAARRSRQHAALAHLLMMFPYWAWYSQLSGGLPVALGAGVSEFAVLLIFPMLTLVTVEGWRGAAAAGMLSAACLLWRWDALAPRIEGMFLLGSALLIGLVFRRLAVQLETAQQRLHHMAFHDALTELPNRRALQQFAAAALEGDGQGALLFVDLDRFKSVNDVLGHNAGDAMLRDVAERLTAALPSQAVAARIGGDEFAVLLSGDQDEEAATEVAHGIVERLREPFELGDRVLHIGASVGVALWPQHGRRLQSLMQCADVAMYRAKTRNQPMAVHRAAEDDYTRSQRGLEVDLWRAIEDGQLRIHVQPVYDIDGDSVVGAEALVRWMHPSRGLVAPASFIELAEETGQIAAIDRWVLRQAVQRAAEWQAKDWHGWIAVNFSARTLEQHDLVELVRGVLREHEVAPERLVIELTESAAMADPETTRERLQRMRELGVRVAIDDFGMGYSSLAYLKRFPADHLKVDRAFTRGIGQHKRDEEVIELVLQLADKWGLDVIAEGVETREQLDWLNERGCHQAQGYLIGKPMDPATFLGAVLQPGGLRSLIPSAIPSSLPASDGGGAETSRVRAISELGGTPPNGNDDKTGSASD
jgi:diguanylate cyclase (GGDEF)-like protein